MESFREKTTATYRKLIPIMLGLLLMSCAHRIPNASANKSNQKQVQETKHELSFSALPQNYSSRLSKSGTFDFQEKKSLVEVVDALKILNQWGYIDHTGFMVFTPLQRRDGSFFEPLRKTEYHPDFNYLGLWWKNFVKSID